jgi:ketopantoate reductase
MRIMVFGTGGAGGFFGAQLANAGEDVVFIARGEHLEAICRPSMPETSCVPPVRRRLISGSRWRC